RGRLERTAFAGTIIDKGAVVRAAGAGITMRFVNLSPDQIAANAAYQNVAGKVIATSNSGCAYRAGQTVSKYFREGPWIFVRQYRGSRPGNHRVGGRK